MSNDCYDEFIERIPLIPDRGGRQLLLDLFDEKLCRDEDCLVHGSQDLANRIRRLADQYPSDVDFMMAIIIYLKSTR